MIASGTTRNSIKGQLQHYTYNSRTRINTEPENKINASPVRVGVSTGLANLLRLPDADLFEGSKPAAHERKGKYISSIKAMPFTVSYA